MANIFISSTYKDLKDYRERVSKVIRKMGHIDVAMEYYGAEDKRPIDRCLKDAAVCDFYIGIFAWRYGYIPTGHEKSITELEYMKARECNRPCLIFLLKEDAPWPMSLVDKENLPKIEALRKEFSDNHSPAFFSSIEELGECIAEAIYKNMPSSIILPDGLELNVKAYYNAILKRYKIVDLDALTPPEKADFMEIQLRSVFVEQDVRENPPPIEIPKDLLEKLIKDEKLKEDDLPEGLTLEGIKKAKEAYFEKPILPVLDVVKNSKNGYVVILGDPGSGKSTLCRYIILSLITKEDEKLQKVFDGYLPLLIELRDYAAECTKNRCTTFIEYLDFLGKTRGFGLNKESLDNYLKNNGKAIVIFDGLDEIFDLNQREGIEQQIIGFTIDYPKTRVIVTSRVIGYKRRNLTSAGFSHYALQDFRKPQIDTFIDKWYSIALINNPDEASERKERINRSLGESASIRQLAGNPLLLTIMAIINKHQELPRERWRLYEHASSVLIHHWDWERRIKEWNIKIEYVSKDDKEELLRRIAYRMQSAPKGLAGNYIHVDTLQVEFENYFKERYQKNPDDAKLAAHALVEQLHERNFILCLYGSNLYGFIHRTFLEYFCAWAFVWKFNVKHEIDIGDLKGIFDEHWQDESWHEVLRLICGMIDEKFAGELIDYLINFHKSITIPKYTEWGEEFFEKVDYAKEVRYSEINFAIECMTELKNLDIIRDISAKLLKITYDKIFDFETPIYLKGERNRIILSAISIGKRWPGREQLINWIQKLPNEIEKTEWLIRYYYISAMDLGNFIGSIGAEDEKIKESVKSLLQNDNLFLKYVALVALATGWHNDIDALKLLQKYALEADNEVLRVKAVSLIGQRWRGDINSLDILQNCALTDKTFFIRNSAIQILTDWLEDDDILPRYCDLAKSASDFNTRQFAVQQVSRFWNKNVNVKELLKDRAVNDTYSGVREIAILLLGEQWKEDHTVISMLRERILREPNPAIRESIYKILGTKDA